MNRRAQGSLFDAFLFLLVMLLSSVILVAYSNAAFQSADILRREEGLQYAGDTRAALMRTTLRSASYMDSSGQAVTLQNGTEIEDILLMEAYLVAHGLGEQNFADINSRIKNISRSLIRSEFLFAVVVVWANTESGSGSFIISALTQGTSELPSDRYTSQWQYPMVTGERGSVTIALHLWFA